MVILDMTKGLNHIGRLGENEHRAFRFPDSCEVLAMYPGVYVSVLVKRPGDAESYPVAPGYVEIRNGAVYWTVQSGDLIRVGRGKVELSFIQGTTVAKNFIYDTYVDNALDGSGEAPEPWESWQTDMAQVAAEIAADREAAQTAATGAETAKTGAETAQSSAETAARNAATRATAAGDAATAAARSAEQANQSAGTAAGAAGAAGQAATTAGQSAQAAAGSATTAGTKATEAAGSATAAGASALVAEGYAVGTQGGVPVGTDSSYYGNNADYFARQAAQSATDANTAKQAVQNMTVSATPLAASATPTATKTTDQQTGAVNIEYGLVPGTTYTPSVSGDGTLSFTNDGGKVNPAAVNIAEQVRGVFDEIVTGTDPVIVGVGNHRYLCGEVATIDITPSATGIIDVIFTSGTTPTVLTLPATVLMPEWFDVTALEPERIYEIGIEEGVYGGVRSWAL